MAENRLLVLSKKILAGTPVFLIGRHRITPEMREDYAVIINGLALWCSLLLDQCDQIGVNRDMQSSSKGRIANVSFVFDEGGCVSLTESFAYLDRCTDILFEELAADDGFKVHRACERLRSEKAVSQPWFSTCIRQVAALAATMEGEGAKVKIARELLQATMFLKKIRLARPDLAEDLNAEFLSFEKKQTAESFMRLDNPRVERMVREMNKLARQHCSTFSIAPLVPKHGPGVVSDSQIKCWYDKYLQMKSDDRIGYLLRTRDLGSQSDFNPFVSRAKSDRTSRFIGVPKTWKKLRGIAAEPVELMFYQQAVFHALDRMFQRTDWWRARLDLHSQLVSQELALEGSRTGRLATVDLSAASDSVTLELVKRVFKGTPVLPWLLGTRSTSTNVDGVICPLSKFASMGSACCFPTESMVFALAAQVASDRTPGKVGGSHRVIRVFGDDIIVQSETIPALLDVLTSLGFSVNTEKSFWTGRFREACGAVAFLGSDIRPIRYSDMVLVEDNPYLDNATCSQAVGFCNQLFERGYHESRKAVLELLFQKRIKMAKNCANGDQAVTFSQTGEFGTCASTFPTNFHLTSKWNRPGFRGGVLYALEYQKVSWSLRPLPQYSKLEESDDYSTMKYVEWQIRHQAGLRDWDEAWQDGFLDIAAAASGDFVRRFPVGTTMVPTRKWVSLHSDITYTMLASSSWG